MSLVIAIVGCGKVANDSYLPWLARQADVSLIHHSRTRDKAAACAQRFGGQVADSLVDVMAAMPDAVMVLTGEGQRFAAAMELIRLKPRRLFFEKPLVAMHGQANVDEDDFFKAKDMLGQAASAGIETAMIFNYRFFQHTVKAKAVVQERNFGALVHANLLVHHACWSHCIDLLHHFGGRCHEISALAAPARATGPDSIAAAFRLEGGASGTIQGTSETAFDGALYRISLAFERGRIDLDDLDVSLRIHENGSRHSETRSLSGNHSRWGQYQRSFEQSLSAYLDSVRTETAPPIPGIAGLEELQFEAGLRRSATERRAVVVAEEFPLLR